MNNLYERLGGENAIVAAVELFYEKVTADDELAPFFEGLSVEKLSVKMVRFITWAFGGPEEYKGKDLRTAHKGLVESKGLTDKHFDGVAIHLKNTLEELGIEESLINEVISLVAGTRAEVLNK